MFGKARLPKFLLDYEPLPLESRTSILYSMKRAQQLSLDKIKSAPLSSVS